MKIPLIRAMIIMGMSLSVFYVSSLHAAEDTKQPPPPEAQKTQTAEEEVLARPTLPLETSANGIRVRSFLLTPSIDVTGTYDDNVFRADNKQEDYITETKPALLLETLWDRHQLKVGGDTAFGTYQKATRDDYVNFNTFATLRYDIAPETFIEADIRRNRQQVGLDGETEQDQPGTLSYTNFTQQIIFTRALSYIQLKLLGRHEEQKLSSDQGLAGNADYSDREKHIGQIELAYEYLPDNRLFVLTTIDKSDYQLLDDTHRESDGLDIRGGWDYDGNGLFSWSLFGGHLHKKYSTNIPDLDDTYIGGSFNWDITRLTTLTLNFDRTFTDTTEQGSAGFLRTMRQLQLKHDFTDKFSATLSFGVDDNDYISTTTAAGRSTRIKYAGISGAYKMNDSVTARLSYDYRERTSDRTQDEYDNNRVMLNLNYKY